jgi:CDP-diglyceride synthetase
MVTGMLTRTITGVVGAAVMLTLFTLPFPVPILVIAAIWLIAIYELGRAVKAKPAGMILVIALNGAVLWALGIVATRYLHYGLVIHQTVDALDFSAFAFITCILQLILSTAILRGLLAGRTRIINFCWHSLVLISVPLCIAASWGYLSPFVLILLLGLAAANDTGAVAAGKLFGHTRISLRISPNKTLEGVIGGFAAMTAFVFAVHFALSRVDPINNGLIGGFLADITGPLNWLSIIAVCAWLAFVGFLGDITFSAIKRNASIKDFGVILPGHGGMLDRIDSLLFIAPWYFLILYLTIFRNVY